MAHHQKQQQEAARRGSAMQSLLKMFSLSNANSPTVPTGEDDVVGEADEPPDDQITDLPPTSTLYHRDSIYPKTSKKPQNPRRESLLSKAIWEESHPDSSPLSTVTSASRGLSTASSHSTASMGDLTSDGDLTSARSMTPSPPLPPTMMHGLHSVKNLVPSNVIIAPVTKDDKPSVAVVGEAAIEKTLGRKRRIMFACGGSTPDTKVKPTTPVEEKKAAVDPAKRKCMLTFACPTRQDKTPADTKPAETRSQRKPSPAPISKRRLSTGVVDDLTLVRESEQEDTTPKSPISPKAFHEFASSQDEHDAWVHKPVEVAKKLTVSDCMKKENAIRQTCTQAEDEAEEEEREQEELENELEEEAPQQDDFAPSDEESDAGNESDDEGGFADSDDESDAGSDYQFWAPAPSTTTAATSTENLTLSHFSSRGRSRGSSLDSDKHSTSPNASIVMQHLNRRRAMKLPRMRPGTPELPDSTDFVCGTLDEDRPLEAAYISCREQKKRAKYVPIPQDIDPSFPTTDPDDNDDEEENDEVEESVTAGGPMWLKDQFADFEKEGRGRAKKQMGIPGWSPPPARTEHPLPTLTRRSTNTRSPPPKRTLLKSPPPKKLFGQSPARLRSPPPQIRLRSPPGSPSALPGLGLNSNRLAQRPLGRGGRERTTSLPRTPNPFFRNYKVGSTSISNVASGAVTPAVDEMPRPDLHVRGPVDIVMGLEKKRQKRKEKFWRQHGRKQAREQVEKRPAPGRGAERMRELGLECAERTRGYGLGQTQLVISL